MSRMLRPVFLVAAVAGATAWMLCFLLGLRNGLDAIPADWKAPIQDRYELQVTGQPRQWRIADLARQIAETGAALARSERPSASAAEH